MKRRPLLPPPFWSSRLYVRLAPQNTRLFRYFLEAYDNLAYTSVVERKSCILKVMFSPDQKKELESCLAEIRQSVDFEIVCAEMIQVGT